MKEMKVTLTAITPNPEAHCERAARRCYDSVGKMKDQNKATNLVKSCTVSDHLTINGHASASFYIEGISRGCSHQLVRHRHACFSQRSQRYVKEDQFEYVIPVAMIEKGDDRLFMGMMSNIQAMYDRLIGEGYKKEDARAVLPNACCTELEMTMSFEGWIHFLRRRMDKHAQVEIRELAFEIYRQLHKEAPKIFNETTIMAPRKLDINWDEV